MKFNIPEKPLHKISVAKWRLCFLWWPRRTDVSTVRWLERASVREISRTKRWRNFGPLRYAIASYEYGPVGNVLMQPGDDAYVNLAQWAPGPEPSDYLGSSLSAAQASGAALQGGLGYAAQNYGACILSQGNADVGIAAHGRHNTPSP